MLIGLVLWGAVALAQIMPGASFVQGTASGASYVGPGDTTSWTAWYGLRPYKASFAGSSSHPGVNITRTSDSHTCDLLTSTTTGLGNTVNCSPSGDNGQSAASFCAATTCIPTIGTGWYDQTKNGACTGSCDLTAGWSGTQFQLTLTGVNGLPGLQTSANPGFMQTASGHNFTPSAAVVSMTGVTCRTSGTQEFLIVQTNGAQNRIKELSNASPIVFGTFGGTSGSVTENSNDTTCHSVIGVVGSGTGNSSITIDGSTTTGTVTGNTTAGRPIIPQNNGVNTILIGEAGFIDNVAWSGSTIASVYGNQKSFWGTP
ncbi:MAG: hypothetical protein WA459_03450 [Stellaceae bacterium]